jgi:ferric-chelate reductase
MLKPGPGQHYFLYQPLKLRGWENHPFTLGAYETIGDSDTVGTAKFQTECKGDEQALRDKEIQVTATSPSSSTPSSDVTPAPSQHENTVFQDAAGRQKLTFFIRPFSSWTKRLRQECLKSPDGMITPSVFIEGPYGERSPLNTFENVVFVVGGTGIAGAVPYILEHIRTTTDSAKESSGNARLATRTRDITLLWSAKQSALIRNIAAHELKPILGHKDIHVHLHATSPFEVPSSSSSSDVNSKEIAVADMDLKPGTAATGINDDALNIAYGRPDIRKTILDLVDEVHEAGAAGGKIAILTCGPGGMADEARAAVHTALKQGKRGVEYIEETFG